MAVENFKVTMTQRALSDMSDNANLGRIVGRVPGSDGVDFVTAQTSARVSLGVLHTNGKSGSFVEVVVMGFAAVKALNVISAGYLFTVSTSAQAVAILNTNSAYPTFGQFLGPNGPGILGNTNSGALGTAWIDFLNPGTVPVSGSAALLAVV